MKRARWLLAAIAAAVGFVTSAQAASADVTQTDNVIRIVMVGAVMDQDQNIDSGAATPTFQIQVLYPVTSLGCHMNFDSDTPCGTQQTSGCPATQCWTYTPTVKDGDNFIYVDYTPYHGSPTYFDIDFTTYVELPHTTIETPPDPNDHYNDPQSFERPIFNINAPDEGLPGDYQCMLTAAGAPPGSWGGCKLPRLKLLGEYRFRARFVDIFGRPDPSPPEYIFSPTPCRARIQGRTPTMSHILHHGLPITVACVQPTKFETDLDLPNSYVRYWQIPSAALGYGIGRTTHPLQTIHVMVHMLRGIPKPLVSFLSGRPTVPFGLLTLPHTLYGARQLHTYSVRG